MRELEMSRSSPVRSTAPFSTVAEVNHRPFSGTRRAGRWIELVGSFRQDLPRAEESVCVGGPGGQSPPGGCWRSQASLAATRSGPASFVVET
jgi:hypothetical protein